MVVGNKKLPHAARAPATGHTVAARLGMHVLILRTGLDLMMGPILVGLKHTVSRSPVLTPAP